MDLIAQVFANVLAFYYSFTHSYALAILLLTLTVMILVLPLTLKATRSMIILQKVAPELKKLQDKHKNDRQKLNEEMMTFYRENKINPLSGCLPLLVQLPIFWFLYHTLNGLTHRTNGVADPLNLAQSTQLYEDIVAANGHMVSFGMDFAAKATDNHGSIWATIPFFALILIMVVAQYWQQRQLTSRAPAGADTPQAEMMRKLQKIMPPVFGVVSIGFPAALVLYWAFQSVIRVFQQWAMYRFDPKLSDGVEHARQDANAHLKRSDRAITTSSTPRPKRTSTKTKRKGR